MRAGLVHGLGNLLPGMTGLLTAPLTARALGVEDRGVVTVLLTAASLFAVAATAGLGWGARTAVASNPAAATTWTRWARWVALACVAPSMVLVFWLVDAWQLSTAQATGLAVLFGFVCASAIRSVQGNVLVSLGSLAALGLSNVVMALLTAGLIVTLFVLGHLSVATVLLANALGLAGQSGVLVWALSRQRMKVTTPALPSICHAGPLVAPARPKLFLTALAQTLDALSTRLDVLLVAAVADARALGLYSVAAIVPQVAYFFFLTLTQRSYAKSPGLTIRERSRLLFLVCLDGGLLVAGAGGAIGQVFIEPVFGRDFGPARDYLWPAMTVTVGLGALIPTLLNWQRGGRSTWASLAAVVGTGVLATTVGLLVDAWWGVAALGAGLIGLGFTHHVRSWGWLSPFRDHGMAWKAVVRGVA